MTTKEDTMNYRRRLIGCTVGALMIGRGRPRSCRRRSSACHRCRLPRPVAASAQDCTAEQIRAALD